MVETVFAEGFGLIVAVATFLGFLAKKTGQPMVISYIVTGLVLGPVGFGAVEAGELTRLFSELGLVFLLFLIGLEISIDEVKDVLKPSVLIGISQMFLTLLLGLASGILLGFSLFEAFFIGVVSMFSSTALVVKMLSDRDEGSTLPERLDISILLVQDIAVVLILALITINTSNPVSIAVRFTEIIGMIGLISAFSILSSRYFLPRVFRRISDNRHAFFVHGIAWALVFISAAQKLNLSMEIGAFFAGLSLAQLPYSRELQERVRPLTDLFIAVFFINFGLGLAPQQLTRYFFEAVALSAVLIAGKFLIVFWSVDSLKFTPETSFKTSLNLTQVSEFSLVLVAIAASNGLISGGVTGLVSLTAILTMGASSYLITYSQEIYQDFEYLLAKLESEEKTDVEVSELKDHAVLIGYDEMSRHLLPVLNQYFDQVLVVDRNPENIDELAGSGNEFLYGDFRHGEIRSAANLPEADLIVSVVPDLEVSKEILEAVDREPTVFVKASNREEAGELYEMGAHYVIIKNILSGEKMKEYVRLILEDRELFREEIKPEIDKILYGGAE